MKSLKGRKSSAPNESLARYRKHLTLYCSYMLKMSSQALEVGRLPQSFNEAVITVLPKKGKSRGGRGYGPISIINVDQNFLAKTLAIIFNTLLGKLVKPDQTGLVLLIIFV